MARSHTTLVYHFPYKSAILANSFGTDYRFHTIRKPCSKIKRIMNNQGKKKRPSMSPIRIDENELLRKTENELKVCMLSFSTPDQNLMRPALRNEIYAKLRNEFQVWELISRNRGLKDKVEDMALKLETAQAELDAGPYLELLQRKVMPTWLLNDEDLTPECKWESAFEFSLTRTARILVYRIEKMQIGVDSAANILSNSYDVFSKVLEHKKKVRHLNLSDEAWQSFFNKVGIMDPVHQTAFKLLVQPFTKEEFAQVGLIANGGKENFIFLVKYLNIQVTRDGENDTSRQIEERYENFNFVKFYYPRDQAGKYTNMVIFQLDSCTHMNAYEMFELLKKNPRTGCTVNVKYDLYTPNRY